MNPTFDLINIRVYKPCKFRVSNFQLEAESQDYKACKFKLNGHNMIGRNAKITPKKVGQFVTFWKRIKHGPIEPFDENDDFNFLIVNLHKETRMGQFVFPKSVLINKGIVSAKNKEGKRAFRVYPDWDDPYSKQAIKSQNWQKDYFYRIDTELEIDKIKALYSNVHAVL